MRVAKIIVALSHVSSLVRSATYAFFIQNVHEYCVCLNPIQRTHKSLIDATVLCTKGKRLKITIKDLFRCTAIYLFIFYFVKCNSNMV